MTSKQIIDAIKENVFSFLNNKTLGSILMVSLGAAIAFTILILLGSVSSRDVGKHEAKTKDTVYVKLVDSMSRSSFTQQTKDSTPAKKQSFTNNNPTGPSGNSDTQIIPFTSSKAKPIDRFNDNQLATLNKTEIPVWKWLILPSILLIIGTSIYLSFKKLPLPNYKLTIDKDPEELTLLFGRHAETIQWLGNPRKIKRFSNKVRFQYHYLKNQKLINSDKDLDDILLTLLYIENNPQKMNLDKLSETDKRDILKWFKTLIGQANNISLNDNLAKHLLQLNKNVIA
jgi:hypothetical protein